MLVTVLYRAAGAPQDTEPPASFFSDVPSGTWCADAVYWGRETGVVTGYGDGRFGPNDPVNRQQVAAILWRYAGSEPAETSRTYADRENISAWAWEAVDWAAEAGVMYGIASGRFEPHRQATRAEAAVVLPRYLQAIEEAMPEEPEPPAEEESAEPPAEPVEPEVPEMPEEPESGGTLLPNTYDLSAFVIENGFLTYQGGTPSYVGVDVSSHQDWIDWNRVAAAGVDFAMIRVGYRGYTAGRINPDPYWEHNIAGALAAGLDVGIYFYSQATKHGGSSGRG